MCRDCGERYVRPDVASRVEELLATSPSRHEQVPAWELLGSPVVPHGHPPGHVGAEGAEVVADGVVDRLQVGEPVPRRATDAHPSAV